MLPGISRVFVAMARDKNIPGLFKTIHPVHNSAYLADLSVLVLVVSGILYLNVVDSIKLSAFFILIYIGERRLTGRAVARLALESSLTISTRSGQCALRTTSLINQTYAPIVKGNRLKRTPWPSGEITLMTL